MTSPLPVGPTTLTVTATTPGGSTSQPITFTTVAPPTVAILSPADNGTATTTPTISGTATPLASVTVLAPGGQSCVTTASVSGTFACSSLTFAAGPQSVTATVSNPGGTATDVNTFTVVQPAVNQAPVVVPDFNDVVVGLPATGNVLTNDRDPEGTPLTASVVGTSPAGLTLSPNGSYTYTAPAGTTAPVTVPIQVCDGATPPSCATTTLTLIPVPVGNPATNDAPIANPDSPKTTTGVPVLVAVLANDVDPEGHPLLNPVIVTQPTHGTALVNADGTVSYSPAAGYTGTDVLTYRVCDGGTPPACSTALVTFSIEPAPPVGVTNTAPVALDDALLTQKGISATATVAANDSDPQGQPLVFAKLTSPANGTVVFSPTGSYTYIPGPTFVGSDRFTYQVCDNASPALCTTATAYLTVQPTVSVLLPPVATSDIANTNSNVPLTGNVLTNDVDPQGGQLTAGLIGLPTAGTVSMGTDGTYFYTPPVDFTGVAGFCYSVSNTAGLSSSACVSINVNPISSPVYNDRPIANNDNTQTTAGTSVTVAVLANDTDPDDATTPNGQLGNPTIIGQPTVGTAVVNANGTVTFTPPANFTGVVSFTYQVCDNATPASCATAVVTVNVQPTPPVGTTLAPVAVDDALLVRFNTPKSGDVSINDADPNTPPLPLVYSSGQPASGTVVMTATGSYTYTPAPGFTGSDSFLYLVCNSAGKCDVATVSLNVQPAVNLLPVVTPDFNDVVVGLPATGNVLTNDRDPEGTPLTASVVGTSPAGLTLSPNGSYTYTAPAGTTAPVTVPIQVCDGATPPSCATTTLTLIPVPVGNPATNDAPIANPDSPKTTTGVPVLVAVLANDVDPEGHPLLNPVIVTQPTHGTALVNADGTVSYSPAAGYTGTDVLTYRVCDGGTPPACSTALVTFSIEPAPPVGVTNTAPVALDDALLTQKGISATATVAANDSDPQGQPLVFSLLSIPSSGTLVFSPTGSYTYIPGPTFVGSDAFIYQVCDNATPVLCATATAYLTVQPSTPPTIAILSPADNGTATSSPTVSGTATPLAGVTVLAPGGQSCVTTASASGTFACSSLTFAAGPQSVTAIAGNVNGTATDVNAFTAVGPPSLTVTSPNGVSTTTTPTIAGTATPGAIIAITDPLGATLCSTTASASGTFACALTSPLPVGPTTLTVTATTPGGSTSQPITFTTVAPPTVAILSPADNGTATTTPTISGTATPLASVTVLAPGGQSCVTTASVSGTFACSSLTFAAGPQSVTATVSNPGGTATDVNAFTALAPSSPASLTVAPTGPQTTTAPVISGTATPGSTIAITDPSGATLCTTTASASGMFACTVTVPAGPTTLTVTACTSGGCSTTTTSFTAVAPPVVAILSPANSSTQPVGTRVISGTATPGSTIILTTSTSESLTTTASPTTGVYSVTTAAPFPAGTDSVTAVASNVGGNSSPATSTFTIIAPPSLTATAPPVGGLTQVISGTTAPNTPVVITGPGPLTLCTTTASSSGTFACSVSLPVGPNTLTVTATGPGGSTSVPVTVSAVAPPTVAILSPADNGTATTTPTISGTATPLASVTVLAPGGQSCVTTASASGTFACSSLTFAAGPQSVTATVSNPGGTATDVNAFTAVGPPSLTVTSPNGVSTTTTPTIAGTATPGAIIAITDPLGATLCSTTASASGTFACALTSPLPVGPTTLTVTATTPGGSTSQPITFTTVAPPTVAILSPADNGTATTTPTISGTATPLASVTVLAPGGQSCVTTASASGTFACSSLTFAAGPQSVTAVVSTPGGTVTDVNTFTAVTPVAIKKPVVTPDIANTSPGKPVSGNLLTNDSDPQGLPLTASLISQPVAGTVTMAPDGSYTYTAPVGFTGTVSFCYTASNTAGLSASSCVQVNVIPDPVLTTNNRPIANNDNVQSISGQSLTIAILANDTDPDSATSLNGQLAIPTILSPPTVGTAVMNGDGTVTYTSPAGFTGVVSFPYQVCDRATPALCTTATVTVRVDPTPPVGTTLSPVAVDDLLLVTANTTATATVAANDSDPQGLPLQYTTGQPVSGTVVMSPLGTYTYTPAAGYSGGDSFTYTVCNPAGKCDVATVSVLVQQPVNPNAVVLKLRVMLQGALFGSPDNLMRDDLRSQKFLPLTEPYSALGAARFTHVNGGGGETMPASVTALNAGTGNAVVDWVFVELRDPSNLSLVVATRSAMVQRDGDVVLASDGVSPLSFTGLSGNSFYVSVKHRNHLGVMTATAVPLSATGTIVDFPSSTSAQVWNKVIGAFDFDGWEQVTVNGQQALWAGDANHNGKVKYQGSINDLIAIFSEVAGAQNVSPGSPVVYNYNNALGYYFGDINMDGKVKYQGTSNDTSLIFINVITNFRTNTQMNSSQLYNFDFMLEQIP
ncbi:Ig-like domain-containing protein [uncultured Fibrella sp.]|uniref:Ig-like domain-containing protein n=1 Tax=uncultured Fibrella sp. TaxID=1284596 RepID=UPI0035CA8379